MQEDENESGVRVWAIDLSSEHAIVTENFSGTSISEEPQLTLQ